MRITLRACALGAGLAAIVFLAHLPYIRLPYFWDELGQFVPAALDIFRQGAWIPRSTVPNAHPPAVMAYLALVWSVAGYSIASTRLAMLAVASAGAVFTYLLARVLSPGRTPAVLAVLFLLVDPLFYTQSMMAQLDMPAMVFTMLGLWLFLTDRHRAAAVACTALVLAKETGALLPLIFIVVLYRDPSRRKFAPYYLVPFAALAIWFLTLWRTTGHLFGDAGFTRYNTVYALNPVRASVTLLRRLYYLFLDDFRWIGAIAIVAAWKQGQRCETRAWRIVLWFSAAHILLVSVLGGAALERYLLPVLPLLYVAIASALRVLRPGWRRVAAAGLAVGLLLGIFVNPPFPFPYENNLAMTDFIALHRTAAQFVESRFPRETIYTAWPLTQALRNPVFGYVGHPMLAAETSDLRVSTLRAVNPQNVRVLVLYSRTWEPSWGVLRWGWVRRFLARHYEYEREMTPAEVADHFGLKEVQRWTQRGQWIEVFARP